MRFGLKEDTIIAIRQCLARQERIEEAVLYGSRAMGTFRPGSDIDLTLKGSQLTLSDVFRLENDIDDLLLPYTFDISRYDRIDNPELIDHINQRGILFYRNTNQEPNESICTREVWFAGGTSASGGSPSDTSSQ